MTSLFEQFKYNRDARASEPAFLIAAGDRSIPITWQQFARDVESIAWLARRFIPGATVGLLGENSYEWVTADTAGLFAGITVVPLETTLSAAEIAERLVYVGARMLVHSALYETKAREVERLVPGLIVGAFGSPKADEYMAIARAALDMGDDGVFDLPPRDEHETATIVFTSGTTSHPRGAELTLASFATFAAFAAQRLQVKPANHSLMLLPLYHIYGRAMTYMMLAHGVALGVCPDFRRLVDAVVRFRANYLCLVPALAEIFAAKVMLRGKSVEAVLGLSLDWILSGGAPLPQRVQNQLNDLGVRTLQIYGLTETMAQYAMSPCVDPRPGSVGTAAREFGMETKVSDEGHLLIRGPSVMKGYFHEKERTAERLDADGWFDTGDVGRIDADGYVYLEGRASRTIVLSSGKKVAPEELEDQILSIPGIREVVVSGDGATRDLRAEVYASVPEETVRRQIDYLNRHQPVHKRIRFIDVRTTPFPRTASGKIRVERPVAEEPRTIAPAVLPTPAPVPASKRPRGLPSLKVAGILLSVFTLMAVAVLFLNFLQAFLVRSGVQLPHGIKVVLDFVEESGEFLLAILVLPVVFFIHQIIRYLRERR